MRLDWVGLPVFAWTLACPPKAETKQSRNFSTASYLYHNTVTQSSELNILIISSSYAVIAKRYAIALRVKATVYICTTAAIVDSIAVADV
jgi:hypothetical protein